VITLGWILIALASYIAILDIFGCTRAIVRKRRGDSRGYSNIPVLSLLLCCIAWLIARPTFGFWAFVPAILDPATWSLIYLPFYLRHRGTGG
jgi:hypothetical protein